MLLISQDSSHSQCSAVESNSGQGRTSSAESCYVRCVVIAIVNGPACSHAACLANKRWFVLMGVLEIM